MGRKQRRMKLVFAVAVLFAAAHAMNQQPPISPQEITEMVVPAVKGAQAPMKQMLDVEEAEVAEMSDISQAADKLMHDSAPPTQTAVSEVASRIELDTNKAISNEEKQQELALSSMHKAKQLIEGFHSRGVHLNNEHPGELGEAQNSPMQSALQHIETVEKALERDTATSNTEAKIKGMKEEAMHLKDEAKGAPQMAAAPPMGPGGPPMDPMMAGMGPGGPPMDPMQNSKGSGGPAAPGGEELGETGAIDDLSKQAEILTTNGPGPAGPGPAGPGPAGPAAAGPGGAIGDLNRQAHMSGPMPGPPMNHLESEMEQLQQLEKEEVQVESAEHNDEAEVKRLVEQLG